MATRLRQGEVSSREITEAHLEVAERDNHALNAWLTIDRERALGEAFPETMAKISSTGTAQTSTMPSARNRIGAVGSPSERRRETSGTR